MSAGPKLAVKTGALAVQLSPRVPKLIGIKASSVIYESADRSFSITLPLAAFPFIDPSQSAIVTIGITTIGLEIPPPPVNLAHLNGVDS